MDEGKMYGCMIRSIFCMCILLCYKQWLVLGYKQVDTSTDKEASDEQKELQQALFLVELLKSEYARVLRENKEMQSNRVLWEEGAMTCATTKRGKFERAPATPQVQHWPRRIPPIFPALRKWRRRFPQINSNIYYDIPARNIEYNEGYEDKENARGWRRFQYEDAFGPQPGESSNTSRTTKTTIPSSYKASSVISSAPTSILSTENDNILTVSTSSPVVSTPKTTISEITTSVTANTTKETVTTSLTSSSHTTRRIMLLLSKKSSSTTSDVSNSNEGNKLQSNAAHIVSSTKFNVSKNITPRDTDLEVSQAAAELEKELGSNLGNWKKRASRKLPQIWRATTRVHLAGSTRYQIPLPENHAFCYTNPDNALCRTFI
ncbi:uncharacterized protein LOC125076069 isoform X2 [Vanessa atalanta]|uniref:uncharacterized protein LOC125076069 isoform X2 n=1 Tax=Vanessa atalanta TaxID=42275 RepID=UPI001FCD4A63|nr:uncharacterized protein LOC125076069 isoform X2 [Vanessa atalanta]